MKNLYLDFDSSNKIKCYLWDNVKGDIKALVHLSHGIAEHLERYDEFARILNENGYIVFGEDHLGHGKEAKNLGIIKKDAMENMLKEMEIVYKYFKGMYKDYKIILFGHSMGSFLSLRTMQIRSNDYDALILCGSNGRATKLAEISEKLAISLLEFLKKDTDKSFALNDIVFKAYNKKTQKKTDFDWLNRDEVEVKKYILDDLCGFKASDRLMISLAKGQILWFSNEEMEKIRKTLPILIISGDDDPVGEYGKGVKRLFNKFRNMGLNDVYLKLYEGARHEILLEKEKEKTFNDCISFLNKYFERK